MDAITPTTHARRYPCEDYVPECRRWSVAHPESCADDEHPAFEFMGVACMQSCGHCAGEVGSIIGRLRSQDKYWKRLTS